MHGPGLTRVPFKLVAIASGLAEVNFLTFLVRAAVTRSARFFLAAGLIRRYGAPMQASWRAAATLSTL